MALTTSGSPTNTIIGTARSQTLTGTSANDAIYAFGQYGQTIGSTLVGGLGDDSYYVHSVRDLVQEKSGEGTDTAYSDFIYSLPAYVENLTLIGDLPVMGTGNAGNNIIKGNAAGNLLDGAAGNDELTGGGGHDIFVINGKDTIMDFGTDDYVNLHNYSAFTTFAKIQAAMTQVGADVVLKLSTNDTATFKNVTIGAFTESNFLTRGMVSNYTQSFGDEFDSLTITDGTSANWAALYPRSGLSAHSTVDHGSVQYFTYAGDTDSFGNAVTVDPHAVNEGILSLTMDRIAPEDQSKFYNFEYTSGMINSASNFSQTYGYFEIRAKMAAGQGLHDAFWLLPLDGTWPPELDIVEQRGSSPNAVIGVAHAMTDDGQKIGFSKATTVAATTDFHTYGLDWQPDFLTWYVDGVAVSVMPTWPGMDKPMYMIANIGGGSDWAGDPDATTPFPASMQIDYIRAYASAHTVEKGVAVDKVGTDGNDELFGTSLNDVLNGGLGDDALYGGAGDDTLTGGGGNDRLEGGYGNDTYIVTSTSDTVSEGDNKGSDTVKTTLSSSYTLPNNVENLIYIGSGTHLLLGNGNANYIQGGDLGGTLSGYSGDDRLVGGAGADQMNGGEGSDTLQGGGGADTLRGNDGNDFLYGGEGDDLIKGDDGNDYIEGGAGNDNLQGGEGDDIVLGGDGADSLEGHAGVDTLIGGAGNDTYYVDDVNDVVTENPGEGSADLVKSRLDVYTLANEVENLNYLGTGNFTGTGNALANKIIGGDGSDILDGAGGADTLTGGAGDDVFAFSGTDADGDVVTDFTGAGAPGGDMLSFAGYGIDGTITQVGDSDYWVVAGGTDYSGIRSTIRLIGVQTLTGDDYVFLPPENHAPTDIALIGTAIAENAAVNSVVGTLTTDDPDVTEVNSFTLLDDAGGRFKTAAGKILLAKALDYEGATSHQITVRVTDSAGHVLDKQITVAVADINDTAPILTSSSAVTVLENQAKVIDLTALDPDTTGEATVYSIAEGGDGAVFQIINGTLEFISAPDFEDVTHAPSYNVTVRASDGTNSSIQTIAVNIADVKTGDVLRGTAEADNFVYDPALTYDSVDGGEGLDSLQATAAASGAWVFATGMNVKLDLDRDGLNDFTAANIEKLTVAGSLISVQSSLASTAVTELALLGTAGADTLDGSLAGVSLYLDGGAGADILKGGSADDVFVVDDAGDTVIELANSGQDTVRTSLASFTLGDNLEALTYTGLANFSGTGNALANTLTGGGGSDKLSGGAGADVLLGGAGNDTYTVDNIGDTVIENANEGIDRVLAQVSYALSENVERLTLSTSKAIDGTGNALANTILGNAGVNVLDGRGGADELTGGGGNDIFVFQRGEANGDVVTDFTGAGTAGGDMLQFVGYGAGAYLTRSTGTDLYVIHGGSDYAGLTETIRLTGVTNLAAGDFTIDGATSSLPSDGGTGTPPADNHLGDDHYVVTSMADVVTEMLNGGYDTVQTTLSSYTLSDNVEALVYTGTKAFTGAGNALDNLIIGSSGSDKLNGGAGADVLKGGSGNDTYTVDNVGDLVVEDPNAGLDRVLAQVSYTLSDHVENLTLTTSKAINGTGNEWANAIVGNGGSNVLDGRGQSDVLTGGAGDDVFQFQRGEAFGDVITDFAGAGATGGDMLRFVGYGEGAYLTHNAGSDLYVIHAGAGFGGVTETVRLAGVVNLDSGDYLFA